MKHLKHRMKQWLAGLLTCLFCLMPAVVRAGGTDAWGTAAQALGIYAAYQSSLKSILALGNDPRAQIASRNQDIQENGLDRNRLDVTVVNRVMNRLVREGDYALRVNSLPFLWCVNDSPMFNAACYPTNYITINRGLVRGLNCDEDELAAVLAHEMTHGIQQHSAHNYAQAVAQYLGIGVLSMASDQVDWSRMAGLVNYSIAKNVTLPTEHEADEGGFYLMTSAGFNPGGAPAAMARMAYYLRYETTDIWEYDSPDKKPREDMYSDHPETRLREQRLAGMMTDYSCGHVTVQDGKDVFIDGRLFITAETTRDDYDDQVENAYYIAGGLARAFHDYDSIEGWNFRKTADGRDDLLTEEHAYRVLREVVSREKAGDRLREMAAAAYEGEAVSKARSKQKEQEAKRMARMAKEREEALSATPDHVKTLRENGDTYSDFGMGDYALMELDRVFASVNQDNPAESYAIRGRAKAVSGDFAGAVEDCSRAVEMDAENPYNFLNRADVYHMAGDYESALQNVDQAMELAPDNWPGHRIRGDIMEELGREEEAEASYRRCYELTKAPGSIPMKYLEKIDAKAAEKLKKKKEEQEKQKIEQEQKQDKEAA